MLHEQQSDHDAQECAKLRLVSFECAEIHDDPPLCELVMPDYRNLHRAARRIKRVLGLRFLGACAASSASSRRER